MASLAWEKEKTADSALLRRENEGAWLSQRVTLWLDSFDGGVGLLWPSKSKGKGLIKTLLPIKVRFLHFALCQASGRVILLLADQISILLVYSAGFEFPATKTRERRSRFKVSVPRKTLRISAVHERFDSRWYDKIRIQTTQTTSCHLEQRNLNINSGSILSLQNP